MSPTDHLAFLEQERQAADRRYNDALTELDRAIVALSGDAPPGQSQLAHFGTALAVFVQQITGFVETKERRLWAGLEGVAELKMQVSIVQRATEALRRQIDAQPPATRAGAGSGRRAESVSPPAPAGRRDDYKYVAFEDQFRGSDEEIRARLSAYIPLFEGRSNVVDIGCGRGEFLIALRDAGISGRGVDLNREMAAIARERGLDVSQGDALAYLSALEDGSAGGLIASQVVEHLEPDYLVALLEVAARKLRAGAPIIVETINPACWVAFFGSYIRDLTHVRPVHPDTLAFLLRASGFERVEVRYTAPVPDSLKMMPVELPVEIAATRDAVAVALGDLARTVNRNAAILNQLMFTHLDFAAIGYRQ